jgi:hypothetical protein
MIEVQDGHEREAGLAGDEHEVVEEKRVLAVLEQPGETDSAARSSELVVGRYLAAERQPPPLVCHSFGVPAQRDLLVEERIACGPVFV